MHVALTRDYKENGTASDDKQYLQLRYNNKSAKLTDSKRNTINEVKQNCLYCFNRFFFSRFWPRFVNRLFFCRRKRRPWRHADLKATTIRHGSDKVTHQQVKISLPFFFSSRFLELHCSRVRALLSDSGPFELFSIPDPLLKTYGSSLQYFCSCELLHNFDLFFIKKKKQKKSKF